MSFTRTLATIPLVLIASCMAPKSISTLEDHSDLTPKFDLTPQTAPEVCDLDPTLTYEVEIYKEAILLIGKKGQEVAQVKSIATKSRNLIAAASRWNRKGKGRVWQPTEPNRLALAEWFKRCLFIDISRELFNQWGDAKEWYSWYRGGGPVIPAYSGNWGPYHDHVEAFSVGNPSMYKTESVLEYAINSSLGDRVQIAKLLESLAEPLPPDLCDNDERAKTVQAIYGGFYGKPKEAGLSTLWGWRQYDVYTTVDDKNETPTHGMLEDFAANNPETFAKAVANKDLLEIRKSLCTACEGTESFSYDYGAWMQHEKTIKNALTNKALMDGLDRKSRKRCSKTLSEINRGKKALAKDEEAYRAQQESRCAGVYAQYGRARSGSEDDIDARCEDWASYNCVVYANGTKLRSVGSVGGLMCKVGCMKALRACQ